MTSGYWFKRHRYGYGLIPVTWQGGLVTGLYIVLVVAGGLAFLDAPESVQPKEIGFYLLFVGIATGGFIQIALRKGPRLRWRWGRKPDDNPAEDF